MRIKGLEDGLYMASLWAFEFGFMHFQLEAKPFLYQKGKTPLLDEQMREWADGKEVLPHWIFGPTREVPEDLISRALVGEGRLFVAALCSLSFGPGAILGMGQGRLVVYQEPVATLGSSQAVVQGEMLKEARKKWSSSDRQVWANASEVSRDLLEKAGEIIAQPA